MCHTVHERGHLPTSQAVEGIGCAVGKPTPRWLELRANEMVDPNWASRLSYSSLHSIFFAQRVEIIAPFTFPLEPGFLLDPCPI